jgi:hypothetical protein
MNSNVALDCDSFDTALKSVSQIVDCSPEDLLARLRSFDFDSLSPHQRREREYEDLLTFHTLGCDPDALPVPPAIHWFHATRVPVTTTFKDGILPLLMVQEQIWDFLRKLATQWLTTTEWRDFRMRMSTGESWWPYNLKQQLDGPFGFLCREIIFTPKEFSHHDYLGIPEIVEDICGHLHYPIREALIEKYKATAHPCIVKFRSTVPCSYVLVKALMYLHIVATRGKPCMGCNTCFDGEGTPVPFNEILRIDWPAQTRQCPIVHPKPITEPHL